MNDPKQNKTSAEQEEHLRFIKEALASVEKARRFQHIKQIVVTTFAVVAAVWFASKPSGPELNIECTVLIFVGLILNICTTKIMSLINKSTKSILQAIADLYQ